MIKAWKLVIHVCTNEHKIIAQMQCKTTKMKNAELYKFHISFLFRTNIFCRVILYWQNIYSNTFKSLFYCKYFLFDNVHYLIFWKFQFLRQWLCNHEQTGLFFQTKIHKCIHINILCDLELILGFKSWHFFSYIVEETSINMRWTEH